MKYQGNTMHGAGGNNPMVLGDIKADTGAIINLGSQVNIAGNINLGTEEYQVETFPPIKIVGETTALKNLQKIEECLMDDEVGKIGVYGMGGVGKTTIMTHIHNKFMKAGTFNSVIWVTVSKESDLKELQDRLSKALSVDLSKYKDAHRISAILWKALERRGKFLLILDDMWRTFPLTKVGVPELNLENKCKIVWTTRSKKVCQGMCSQRIIKVEVLTKDESWTLFKEKLGTNFVLSPEIEPIAKAVVKECDGLPLGIITVGAAMRGVDDIRIWRNALEDLKNSRPNLEGLEDDVFSCLGFSFDHLKTQIHRDCFLYCALYPEDDKIECDSLIEKWMADGFFDEIEDREKGFDKGYTIINDLKDACMLEKGVLGDFNGSFVWMHDLLRDLAIAITRKSRQFVVKVRSNVGKFPRDENLMDDVIRVSLMYSDIELLSCRSKFPKLSTLLLGGSYLDNIDHFFFEHMQNLRVLDLSNSDITCLPQSLSNLVNLHALLLRYCMNLKEVPSLVQLRELRVLDLTGTKIKYLPDGMDSLTNLRCLRLSATKSLEMVPVGAISSLSHLEELSMAASKWKWSSNEDRNGRGAGVEDIVRLMHLKRLFVDFVDLSAFSSYVRSGHWRGLNCFLLFAGSAFLDFLHLDGIKYDFYSRKCQVMVSDSDCMNSVAFPKGNLTGLVIRNLHDLSTIYTEEPTQGDNLANLKSIEIESCPKLKYILSVGWFQTLQNLEEMDVSDCQAMEEMVVDMGDMGEANNNLPITPPRLKRLSLSHLPNLKSICKRTLICSSFEEIVVRCCPMLKTLPFSIPITQGDNLANLKSIEIDSCPKLKYVLSVGWFQTLQNLEEMDVSDCQAMEEMVVDMGDMGEANNNIPITLPRLKSLTLFNLPKLKSICKRTLICSSLEEIEVLCCPMLKTLPFSIPITQGDNLANLKRIEIKSCPKLKYILSVGWFQTLQNLEKIFVADCQAMEEMVVDMGDMGEANNNIPITLPRLKILKLSLLRNLKSICKRTLICSSLEEIVVLDCPMLKTLPFSIPITQGDNLANLKRIDIKICPKLKYILSVGWFQTLQNLEEIDVADCQAMEEMVVDMGDMGEANNNLPITLPRLKRLTLSRLPNLKSICKRTLICSSLEEIVVIYCPMLKTLPFSIPITQGDNLANLKRIDIKICPKLKYILSVGWFQTLQNLEEIDVADCQAMEEMVVDMGDMGEANNNLPITLPRLKRLTLSRLPNLKSICKRTLICSSLEEIVVLYCPMLKTLPFSINSLPSSLKQIKGSRRWWDSLEWDNAHTKMHLQPFFSEDPDYFQWKEDQERQEPDYEDQERQGTKGKADSMDLNSHPLSPRNWQLWVDE